ncbi:MAG TPA: hypothetical protein VFZ52_16475 [Chryseolinea sp.]
MDIYTVSKLLGHKHIVSTERYDHIFDALSLRLYKNCHRLYLNMLNSTGTVSQLIRIGIPHKFLIR